MCYYFLSIFFCKFVLEQAFRKGDVIFIFSVNNCHGWHGYAAMTSPPGENAQPLDASGKILVFRYSCRSMSQLGRIGL